MTTDATTRVIRPFFLAENQMPQSINGKASHLSTLWIMPSAVARTFKGKKLSAGGRHFTGVILNPVEPYTGESPPTYFMSPTIRRVMTVAYQNGCSVITARAFCI